MKTLTESYVEFAQQIGGKGAEHIPMLTPTQAAFMAGAAHMAQQFAEGQGTLALLIRDLSMALTRECQALQKELRCLRNVQAEAAGLSHHVD